jgi:hypothetical protein
MIPARLLPRTLVALAALASASPSPAARGQISPEDKSWWAFQPVASPPIPQAAPHPVDAFLLTRLLPANLDFSPEAPRATLARRLWFTLLGLPAPASEIDRFISDPTPDAWEHLVDRLLASRQYGERWARHWLDLVRYADSDGYKADDYRPDAWRYRDYVIAAFNHDKPWDRFIMEQLAGDELFPDNPEAIVATGYLRCGIYEYNNRDAAGQWDAILNDITDTTSDVFLGLGLQCARCHDHKFDPLLQQDYFRLKAFFAPLDMPEQAPAASPDTLAAWQSRQQAWEDATACLRDLIRFTEQPYRDAARLDAISKFPPEIQAVLAKPEADRSPEERPIGALAWRQITYEWNHLDSRIKGADKEKLNALRKELAAFDHLKPAPLPPAMVARDFAPDAPPTLIPRRERDGAIAPGFPVILSSAPPEITPLPHSSGRRSTLARWIASRQNPLTARVLVNRIWQQHFGQGLTTTASDFGRLGDPPSHPDLLDWLASDFMDHGWSLKRLHRLILTSRAWRQGTASPHSQHGRLTDPANRLLWRWNTRRLDSDQIRDALFSATGELDASPGGPGADHTKPRRSIYTKILRNVHDPLTEAFDSPQQFNSTPQRDVTTTPIQSLLLANSRFMLDRAAAMAADLIKRHGNDDRALVSDAWQRTSGRLPTTDELDEALAFLLASPTLAAPDSDPFISDAMPQRDGRAAVLSQGTSQDRLTVPADRVPSLNSDFTIEAFILLRSVFDDGRVRTIVSQWNQSASQQGWSLGISGLGSRRKPRMPVLQLTGILPDGKSATEAIFSDLQIQLDRSYYLSAAIHFAPDGKAEVTFRLKDLSNDDEPLRVTSAPHPFASPPLSTSPLVIGNSHGPDPRPWDGLIDEIRLRRGLVSDASSALAQPALSPDTLACWSFEPSQGFLTDSVSRAPSIAAPVSLPSESRAAAVADFSQALLSSSGFLYLD